MTAQDPSDDLILDELEDATNDTLSDNPSPSVVGEQSVSGDMPDPESDDDTLANMKQVGLQTDSDYDNQEELNIAEEVEEAEKLHRSS